MFDSPIISCPSSLEPSEDFLHTKPINTGARQQGNKGKQEQQENLRAQRAQVEDRRSPSGPLLFLLSFLLLLLLFFLLPLCWRVRSNSSHRNGRKRRGRTLMNITLTLKAQRI